jgi:hypothetical protein
VLVDVAVDGRLQLDDRAEDAAPEPPPGQGGEEALDGVQPRGRGRGEVEGQSWLGLSEQAFRLDRWSICRAQAAAICGSRVK